MSHAAGKPPHGFHFLRLTELLFQVPPLRDIAVHDDQCFHFSQRVLNRARGGFHQPPGSILVAHAIFDTSAHASGTRFPACFLDFRPIIRMHLFECARVLQLFRAVTQDSLIGGAVVEALAVCIHHGDHVGGIFADQAEQLLPLHQLVPHAVDLELLIDRIEIE